MSRTELGLRASAGVAVLLLGAVTAGCGSGGTAPTSATPAPGGTSATGGSGGATTTAAVPPSSAVGGGTLPASTSPESAASGATGTDAAAGTASLPRVDSDYGQQLITAWVKGDRKAAARVATPEAVAALFRQRPVKDLVNYSCEDDRKPTVCGWIGAGDVRVELSVDSAKVRKGQPQAITRARLAMP